MAEKFGVWQNMMYTLIVRMDNKTKQKEGKMKKKNGGLSLNFIWKLRLKLRAEGSKLCAEGSKLWAEGNKLWAEAILEVYGNIKMEWENYNVEKKDYECHLETGEIFKP